jgi:hypothetical protein
MTRTTSALCRIVVLAAVTAALAGGAAGDCGSIPFYAPLMNPMEIVDGVDMKGMTQVEFDPLKVSVFEPRQRALISWNGKEEILLLSTDQRASEKSAALEVIPLPARPSVRLGSFETFEKAQKLVVEKRMWAVAHGGARAGVADLPAKAGRIAFEKKMGAHDISVAEALDSEGFVAYVQGYLRQRYQTPDAPIRPEFVEIIHSYLEEGFRWFAFDVISLADKTQTRQPIEYRFPSDHVFYPMRISTMERGKTEVDLLVFTSGGASVYSGNVPGHFKSEKQIEATRGEFEDLDKAWAGFFSEDESLTVDQWKLEGDISMFVSDVKAR